MYPAVKASWKELTYEKNSGKPTLRYDPILYANRYKIGRTHVSVSHDGDYVYSSVLIEGTLFIFFILWESLAEWNLLEPIHQWTPNDHYFGVNDHVRVEFTASRKKDASTLIGILGIDSEPFLSSYLFAHRVTCEYLVAFDDQTDPVHVWMFFKNHPSLSLLYEKRDSPLSPSFIMTPNLRFWMRENAVCHCKV